MKYQFDRRGEFKKQFLTDDQFGQEWTSGVRGHLGAVVSVFEVDALLHALWFNYIEFDDRINELALAGKLKPFPEYLK